VVASELGQPVSELFDAFEREPVAAASLGQVHKARVGDADVAIKVLRPGVEDLVALDLDISFRLLFALNILFPNHHVRALTTVVREFSGRVREAIDFREAAAHMATFRAGSRRPDGDADRGLRAHAPGRGLPARRSAPRQHHSRG
jgi:ubiquinone biosynthesis protein